MRPVDAARRVPGRTPLSLYLCWTGVRNIVWLYMRLLYRWRGDGAENVPRTGPIVYVSNHQSHYDPPIVGLLVTDRPFSALARESLFRFKPFAMLITWIGAVPISRESGANAMRAAIGEIDAGRCVLLFPEGTRTRTGATGAFKGGFMLLLAKRPTTVVPIAIEGAHDAWPAARSLPRLRGRIAVRAGAPIAPETLLAMNQDDAIEHVRRLIETMRLELRADLRRRSGGRWPAPGPGDKPCWEIEAAASAS